MFDPHPPCYERGEDWFSTNSRVLWAAAQICKTCPHRSPCKSMGNGEQHGIWGGILKDHPKSTVAVNYRAFAKQMKESEINLRQLKIRLAALERDILNE